MERRACVGDVGARRFDGAMLGVDQVDLRDAGERASASRDR